MLLLVVFCLLTNTCSDGTWMIPAQPIDRGLSASAGKEKEELKAQILWHSSAESRLKKKKTTTTPWQSVKPGSCKHCYKHAKVAVHIHANAFFSWVVI